MPTTLVPTLPGFPTQILAGYRLRLAESAEDLRRVQRLRYEVFNLELSEGFEDSHRTGLDQDEYDPHKHHLLVEEIDSGKAVGTYRMQTLAMAEAGAGFYTATEYDLGPIRELLPIAVEASRACVHADHREGPPIQLLWRGIAAYTVIQQVRYIFGLCSLTSQSVEEAVRAWLFLEREGRLHPDLRVHPLSEFECAPAKEIDHSPLAPAEKLPPLFDAYMRIATRIVGYPAMDRAFKTVDYLALLDLEELPPLVRKRFMPAPGS